MDCAKLSDHIPQVDPWFFTQKWRISQTRWEISARGTYNQRLTLFPYAVTFDISFMGFACLQGSPWGETGLVALELLAPLVVKIKQISGSNNRVLP